MTKQDIPTPPSYIPATLEKRWQKKWEEAKLHRTPEHVISKQKLNVLPQLPYPSGSGLHVGHAEVYTSCDIYARAKRMQGHDVLQVIGWDAFGLPAENFAIKHNVHPKIKTEEAIDNFRYQIKRMGISVDWEREVGSHQPEYYQWTQWFFKLMYNQGLAYRKKQAVNWCNGCKTVLANEQVTEGKCERCSTEVVQKEMEQWFFRITDYAATLYTDLDLVDWPKETVVNQRNWIGPREGAVVTFTVPDTKIQIEVFTTRPDTLYGATYMVLAPEHELVSALTTPQQISAIKAYRQTAQKKTELQRTALEKDKTGEFTGSYCLNPVTGKKVPIWISDYVLTSVGTGAVMGVPAHDQRDFAFASKYNIPIIPVVVRSTQARSYLMGASQMSLSLLQEVGLLATQQDKATYLVEIPTKNLESYKEMVKKYLDKGYWNEIVSADGIWFCFKDKQGKIAEYQLNEKSHEVINQLAAEYSGDLDNQKKSVWQWLSENEFYKSMLLDAGTGVLVNSPEWNGWKTPQDIPKVISWLAERNIGRKTTTYRLRDWSISRQRFWGSPIPMLRRALNTAEKEQQKIYQDYPSQVVQLHAWGSSPRDHFHPWLDRALRQQQIASLTPELPDTWAPRLAKWLEVTHHTLGGDTTNVVLLGRSLGTWVALKAAETAKLRKLILVAPTFPTSTYWERLKKVGIEAKHQQTIREFLTGNGSLSAHLPNGQHPALEPGLDYAAIHHNVGEIVFCLSNNDTYIDLEDAENYIKSHFPYARIRRFREAGHFDRKSGFDVFPQLLDEILMPVNLGVKPALDEDLPITLPEDVDFMPTGQSPLTYSDQFQQGVEKKYGPGWQREVDTLDTFMCSSWYHLRYLDPHNKNAFCSRKNLDTWMPVDFYIGGPEHTNGHLLYARFFHKVLYDAGYVDVKEPYQTHRHQGMILGEDNRKMSKRWNNVINPTEVMDRSGADVLRVYEMFMGPLSATKVWNTKGEQGVYRFLQRLWRLQEKVEPSNPMPSDQLHHQNVDSDFSEQERQINILIKKVTEDIDNLSFNTSIAKCMEMVNFLTQEKKIALTVWDRLLRVLAPFAPHITEELWQNTCVAATPSMLSSSIDGFSPTSAQTPLPQGMSQADFVSIHSQPWPDYDLNKITDDRVAIVIQINGKVRDQVEVGIDKSQDKAHLLEQAKALSKIQKYIQGKDLTKEIVVPGRLVNLVCK